MPGLKPEFYLAYLNSADWRSRRNRVLRERGYRCERCGEKRHLEVHHKTYDRLGAEWDADLEILCPTCHDAETIDTDSADDRRALLLARQAIRAQPFAGFTDLCEAVKALSVEHRLPYDPARIGRAVALALGKRAARPMRRRDGTAPDPGAVTDEDAREILTRLECLVAVKTIAPTEDPGHEARVRQQVADEQRAAYQAERRRKPFLERLAEIFTRDE